MSERISVAYLACPYSDPDPSVKEWRYQTVTKVAHYLIAREIFVYSPLTHNIPIDRLGIHGNWLHWGKVDLSMLERCDRLIVLMLDGWEKSSGVQAEIKHAMKLGLEIEYLDLPPEIA